MYWSLFNFLLPLFLLERIPLLVSIDAIVPVIRWMMIVMISADAASPWIVVVLMTAPVIALPEAMAWTTSSSPFPTRIPN